MYHSILKCGYANEVGKIGQNGRRSTARAICPILYSPQNVPTDWPCAVVVHPGNDFLILGRVWEREGMTVSCFNSMTFIPLLLGTRSTVAFVVKGLLGHTFSSMPFSLRYCWGREVGSSLLIMD